MVRIAALSFLVALSASLCRADPPARDPAPLLARIRAIKTEGQGNEVASAAWKQLVSIGPSAIVPILSSITEKEPIPANWLRSAVDAIAENTLQSGKTLPASDLERFVKDFKQSGMARRLAFEWLSRIDKTAPDRLLPGMLDDPGSELRRDAVARAIQQGDDLARSKDEAGARAAYLKAFASGRDTDQVDQLAQKLEKLGTKVNITTHYGCILHWKLIGPFDNTAGVGFQATYPPEKEIDLSKTYKGKNGAEVKWTDHVASNPRGLVDLNKIHEGMLKGTVVYGYAVVDTPKQQQIQIRAGSKNAIKIFLNGKQVFARDEYHHTVTQLDNHIAFGTLNAGRNEILVKVCQNEQKESWTKEWEFQLRLCDELGGGVAFRTVTPGNDNKEGR